MADNTRNEVIKLIFQSTGNDQLAQSAGNLYDVARAGGAAGEKAQELLDAIQKFAGEDALVSALVSEKAAAHDAGDALAVAKLKLADLQNQFETTTEPSAALERALAKQKSTVDSLDASYNKHQATIAATTNALRAAGIDTNNLDAEQRRIQASLADVGQKAASVSGSMKDVGKSTEEAGQRAKEAGTFFEFVSDHLKEIISIAAAAEIAIKGVEFGKESVAEATQIEQSLSRVRALAQGAAEDFAEMDGAVEAAAHAVQVSTKDASVGLVALVSGGLSAKDAIAALVPTLQLAKIANIDYATAAGIVGKSLDAFGLPASSAQEIVDRLTLASHGAAGGLGAIGNTITTLAPDARALGISFDSLVSIVGLLAQHGVDSEKSLRGLRGLFQQLQDPTSALREQLLALGDGSNDFGRAIASLSANTPRAQQALLSLDGPARSLVLAFGQAGPDALAKFQAALGQSDGIAAKTAKAIDDNLGGAWKNFKTALDDLGEKAAKPILSPLKDELQKLSDQLTKYASSPDFKKIVDNISGIVTKGIKVLDDALQNFDWKSFGDNAIQTLDHVKDTVDQVADSVGKVGTAVNKFGDVVGGAYHVIGATVDSVVAAGARGADAVVTVEEKLESLTVGSDAAAKHLEGVHAALQSVDEEATNNAGEHVAGVVKDFKDLGGAADVAAKGVTSHATASRAAAPQVAEHAAATKDAAQQVTALSATLQPLPSQVKAGGGAAELTSAAFRELAEQGKLTAEAVKGAFTSLGIQSQKVLKTAEDDAKNYFAAVDATAARDAAGLADRQNAFLAYAAKALAANAQLSDADKLKVRADLDAKASTLGVTEALQQLEAQSAASAPALVSDAEKYAQSLRDMGAAALEAELAHQRAAHDQQQANTAAAQSTKENVEADQAAEKAYTEYGDAANAAALATRGITADTSHANDGMQRLTQAIGEARAGFLSISQEAATYYDTVLQGAFKQALANDDAGAGFDRVAKAIQVAADVTNQAIANQRDQIAGEIAQINQLGTSANKSFGSFGNDAASAAARMKDLSDAIASGKHQFGLLGQADLAPLQQALDAARQRTQALADAAKEAAQQLADINDELQDQIDEQTGNKEDQEDRRYQKQLQQIQDLYKQSGKLGTDDYNQAIARAKQLHALNMQQIQEEKQAKTGADNSGTATGPAQPSGSSSSSGGTQTGIGGASALSNSARVVVHRFELPTGTFDASVLESESDRFEQGLRTVLLQRGNSILR